MSLASLLSYTLALTASITATGAVAALFHRCNRQWRLVDAHTEVRLHRFAVALVLLSTLLLPTLPTHPFFEPVAKVWSGSSFRSSHANLASGAASFDFGETTAAAQRTLSLASVETAAATLALILLVAGTLLFVRDLWRTAKLINTTIEIRRVGKVSVVVGDTLAVPFSLWWPGTAYVCLPTSFCADAALFRSTVLHEIEHHRSGDTRFVYAQWLLRTLFFWNVVVRAWMRAIDDSHEFACDEALVDQGKVSARGYAASLVTAAQHALETSRTPECAPGLFELRREPLLTWRIETMLQTKSTSQRRGLAWVVAGTLGLLAFGTAMATQGLVQDRRISQQDAEELLQRAQHAGDFPTTLNSAVLAELNRYLGTAQGRAFTEQSLARMDTHLPLVNPIVSRFKAPKELLAVPFVESGWKNLPHNGNPYHGAGLWMFIAPTARRFGLQVNATVDERLDVEKETVAAMSLLTENYQRFGSWEISLLAYNAGEERVEEAIATQGTRNAWALVRAGVETDKGYLARVMAAVLILANRESL
jgi:beta-lactamase regulating signal transducer with metallopeptidase domain